MTWQAVYASPWQSVWGLALLPALFLVRLATRSRPPGAGAEPAVAGFVHAWAAVFAAESILDALMPALLGVSMLPFVLLGDFRLFLLLEAVSRPARPPAAWIGAAAAWTLPVPLTAVAVYLAWTASRGPLPAPVPEVIAGASSSQVLWLAYEVAFCLLAVVLRTFVVPARRPPAAGYLRVLLAFVAAYYALWAAADVLILSGWDAGWLLRMLPNQLYYGVSVPFAWWLFFATPPSAATSSAAQTSR